MASNTGDKPPSGQLRWSSNACSRPTMGRVRSGHGTTERLSDLIAGALADLARLPGAEERYRGATSLVDQLSHAISAAGKVRAQAVLALRDEEKLSLARLGERLGLS